MAIGKSSLDGIERAGKRLPDPTTLFIIVITILVGVSVRGAAAGWSALNPATGTLVALALPCSIGILLASLVRLGPSIALGWPVGIDASIIDEPPLQR